MSEAWEDLGHVHAPAPRAKRPTAEIETVRYDGSRWEATVRKTNQKRVWLYAGSEREVRAKALAEVNR